MIVTVTLNPAIDHSVFLSELCLGGVNRAEGGFEVAGGKGVNVARMLADDGQEVTATGFLGADNERIFTDLFAQRGIADAFVRLPGKTRTGIKLLNTTLGETTDINFPGLRPDAAAVDKLSACLAQLLRPGCWCVFAGSLPAGVTLGQWRSLLLAAAAQGAQIAVDTTGEALLTAVQTGVVSLIKPNAQELAELCALLRAAQGGAEWAAAATEGTAASAISASLPIAGLPQAAQAAYAAAARLVGAYADSSGGVVTGSTANRDGGTAGVGCVLVSLGAEGALCLHGTAGAFYVSAPPVAVSSTVGAGDSLLAGFLAGLQGSRKPVADKPSERKTIGAEPAQANPVGAKVTAETITAALQLGAAFAAWTLTHADRRRAERAALVKLLGQARVRRLA